MVYQGCFCVMNLLLNCFQLHIDIATLDSDGTYCAKNGAYVTIKHNDRFFQMAEFGSKRQLQSCGERWIGAWVVSKECVEDQHVVCGSRPAGAQNGDGHGSAWVRVPPQGEDSLICEIFITRSIMVNRTRNEGLEFSSKLCPVFRIHTKWSPI